MSTVGEVCHWALKEYINQNNSGNWVWLRESDLVSDLVYEIKKKVPNLVPSELIERNKKTVSTGHLVNISRVRKEVKFGRTGMQKIDICLLNDNPKTYFGDPYGRRNIVLFVDGKDIEEILEVKLDPHNQLNWFDDIIKLYHISLERTIDGQPDICLHSLSLDNSIDFFNAPRRKNYPTGNVTGSLLPLDNSVATISFNKVLVHTKGIGKSKLSISVPYQITLGKVSLPTIGPMSAGVYLWALGVTRPTGTPIQAVPNCWKLQSVTPSPLPIFPSTTNQGKQKLTDIGELEYFKDE